MSLSPRDNCDFGARTRSKTKTTTTTATDWFENPILYLRQNIQSSAGAGAGAGALSGAERCFAAYRSFVAR